MLNVSECARDIELCFIDGLVTKLLYIPLLTPTPRRIQGHTATPKFSDDEVELFLNKSDSDEDERYQLWKKMYEPDYLVSERRSLSNSFLLTPTKTGASKCRIAVLLEIHSSLLTPTETGNSKCSAAVLPNPTAVYSTCSSYHLQYT